MQNKQTHELLSQGTDGKNILIEGIKIVSRAGVFDPSIFFSSSWFAKQVPLLIENKALSFLEIGCGTGIVSLAVAKKHSNLKVYATDISKEAFVATQKNIELNNIKSINIYRGNVFDGIPQGITFDCIFWALPFMHLDKKQEISTFEKQTFDPGYTSIKKFISELTLRLNVGAKVYVGFSKILGEEIILDNILEQYGYLKKEIITTVGFEKSHVDMGIYEICNAL